MKKRLFSFIICSVLSLTLLSGGAWAEVAQVVLIADQDVTDGQYYVNDGAGVVASTDADASTANAYYQDGTLYLNNLSVSNSTEQVKIDSKMINYAIFSSIDLTLNLKGSNTVSTAGDSSSNSALLMTGNFIVTGDGSLTATAGNNTENNGVKSGKNYGIAAGSLTVSDSASVSGVGGKGEESCGIIVLGDIEASNAATISGVGGEGAESSGIKTAGDISASGSADISGVGGTAEDASTGIIVISAIKGHVSQSEIAASDSATISGVGGTAGQSSTGIDTGGKINVSDSAEVSGVGGSSIQKSAGIACGQHGDVNYAGGTLIAKSDAASQDSTAVSAKSLILPESYYWRTSETGNYKHAPEDVFSLSGSETYVELRTQLPPANAPYYIYTVETTDKGFLINANIEKFVSVRLDGEVLDGENYTLSTEDGKLLITLDPDFLQTLPKGEHTLLIYLTDGLGEVKFTVE